MSNTLTPSKSQMDKIDMLTLELGAIPISAKYLNGESGTDSAKIIIMSAASRFMAAVVTSSVAEADDKGMVDVLAETVLSLCREMRLAQKKEGQHE